MKGTTGRTIVVVGIALALVALGVANIVLKATFTLMDDGVLWRAGAAGVTAARVAAGHPGARAGVRPGDVLVAIDGAEVLQPEQVDAILGAKRRAAPLTYRLLRSEAPFELEVRVAPLESGNTTVFYYLSLVGFFSLIVGTIVMLRRPQGGAPVHFYLICLLFFLMNSTSYTGRLDLFDWLLFWCDHLAILLLPAVFVHFCLRFPQPREGLRARALAIGAYLPAVVLGTGTAAAQALFVLGRGDEPLWRLTHLIDRAQPLYFAALFALAFGLLWGSYRRASSLTERKQMKWLVWGTGAGVLPFLLFYAVPFALRGAARAELEIAGSIPLALVPLALAYAVVKHRLMDVELIFRRTLVSFLATALVIGVCLLVVGLFDTLVAGDEPHRTLIAVLSTLVVLLLFRPLKSRIQDAADRIFYRGRYDSRKALLRLSQDLNADLDLVRLTERLQEDVTAALGVRCMAVFLPAPEGDDFQVFTSHGCAPGTESARLPGSGALARRLALGLSVDVESDPDAWPEAGPLDLSHYFPCRARGELIAILGVGRKDGRDPLDSEEVDLLQAVAGQAGTAILNGRLYRKLREKAEALERLTEYNENILESMDSGILVLDLEGRVARWNRAMEALYGRRRGEVLGRPLDEVLPEAFLDALRGSLVLDDAREEIAHLYKLHLSTAHGRSLMVNVAVAPFQLDTGERHGSILIFEDVTARARLEQQLQHAEKMASIGLLAAGVAHEVNTPLAGISSYTQLLREQVKPEDLRYPLLEKIEKQTYRAVKIVNNLLNFARSGGAEWEPVDLNRVLLDVLSLLEHQLEKSRIRVRKELDPELPRVRGNENRLQQVFFNLMLNARDAMPSGGWLSLLTRADGGDTVVVEIKDTGVGIKREDIKRIYDPFFTTKGIGRGTGLGLSVSYGIVQEHGGAIFVDSAPGSGTTFQVALPAYAAEAEAARG